MASVVGKLAESVTPQATTLHCYGCANLTSITAPQATWLDCSGCAKLTSITAPKNCKVIR